MLTLCCRAAVHAYCVTQWLRGDVRDCPSGVCCWSGFDRLMLTHERIFQLKKGIKIFVTTPQRGSDGVDNLNDKNEGDEAVEDK
jgi:hypothetical protein